MKPAPRNVPSFPGPAKRLHWSFPDPSTVTGTKEEKLDQVREIRDEIRQKDRGMVRRSLLTSGRQPGNHFGPVWLMPEVEGLCSGRVIAVAGLTPVPDLDFTNETSELLIEPFAVTSSRKFAEVTFFPDWALV